MKFEYDYNTVLKFSNWAENLPDSVDFIDYWYNLFLSATKAKIESSIANNINAFWWTRWQNDFELYVDKYNPQQGDGFSPDQRQWFAHYMQCLVYALQIPSVEIAGYYSKDIFLKSLKMFPKFHCYGIDYFINSFTADFGIPPTIQEILKIGM